MALHDNPPSRDPSGLQDRLIAVLWPVGRRAPESLRSWYTACVLLVIPLTALLHYLFNLHRCMLETFGDDYTVESVRQLFLRDPSLPWAIAAMVLVYHVGKRSPWVRRAVAPAFAASIPLSVWLWDIPFSGRAVCRHMHDGRMMLAEGVKLDTKWICALCLLFYLAIQSILFYRRRRECVPGLPAAG
jgi:hypothetical protein